MLENIKAMSYCEALAIAAGYVSMPSISNVVLHLQNKDEMV
jgi:hypothetical protein